MAKSTKAQQVSTGTSDSYTAHEMSDPVPPVRIQRAMLGVVPEEVSSSVGGDSMRSSKSATTSSESATHNRLAPAQTTENPSGPTETDSGADSTDGHGQATLSQSDKEIIKPAPPRTAKQARASSVNDDADFAALQ